MDRTSGGASRIWRSSTPWLSSASCWAKRKAQSALLGRQSGIARRMSALHNEDEDLGPSFEDLVGKYHRKIFNLILRTINDTEEALDLTQETFLEAHRQFGSF